jgi:hypothetical protein
MFLAVGFPALGFLAVGFLAAPPSLAPENETGNKTSAEEAEWAQTCAGAQAETGVRRASGGRGKSILDCYGCRAAVHAEIRSGDNNPGTNPGTNPAAPLGDT